jgi:hypothetical protein
MTLLYFSPVPWQSYEQRPHHFVRHFIAQGARVLWVDPYPTRFPGLRDLRRVRLHPGEPGPRPPQLRVIHPRGLPIEPSRAGRALNRQLRWTALLRQIRRETMGSSLAIAVGRPSHLALIALETLKPAASVYDAMDDFPEFYSGRARAWITACEARIASSVSAVLTASTRLWQKFETAGARRIPAPNAYDMSGLPPAASLARPPAPVIGYIGSVGGWFDWAMLAAVARGTPDALIRVIGPRFVASSRPLPPNVELLPACTEAEAIQHMRSFSAGVIPFVRSALTASVDPVKFYGYRAMGLPVLTTRFGEMAARTEKDGVYFLDGDGGLETAVAAALRHQDAIDVIDSFRAEHSWERRFGDSRIFDLLARHCRS